MGLFGSSKSRQRKSHFRNLIALAVADGKLDESEKKLLDAIASRIGLTEKEALKVLNSPKKVKFTPPSKPEERFEQLYDLVLLMMVDGDIDEDEMEYCRRMAIAYGFKTAAIDELVKHIVTQVKNGVNKEKVKSEAFEFLVGL